MWESTNPGTSIRPARPMTSVCGPMYADTSASVPTATIRPPATATALAQDRAASTRWTCPPVSTRSAGFRPIAPPASRRRPRRPLCPIGPVHSQGAGPH
jgi:hypothetical protein